MARTKRPTRRTTATKAPLRRVVIANVRPEIDAGRYACKATVGDSLTVTANIFADGHDRVAAVLRYRHESEKDWTEAPMELINWGLDLWRGSFPATQTGVYFYTLEGWVDRFQTWQQGLRKKSEANQDVYIDLQEGAELLEQAAKQARAEDARRLQQAAAALRGSDGVATATPVERALDAELGALAAAYPDRRASTLYQRELRVVVDREKAGFSAWYEMFPRSASPEPGRHGTFQDVIARLPYVAGMGFDVLYLPPIHPIGRTHRKGKNNNPVGEPEDVGSPWAIGGPEGGHKALHPELGTLADFQRLVAAAHEQGMEVALDVAFNCTPDHPYVKEHPEWFRRRPDGSIRYAENPPKKYEDIYPLDFETDDWRALWEELKSVIVHWVEQGVRLFRVDNPHTKPFAFWEWLIAEVKKEHPDVLFLSEAFTRPDVMYHLAKLGFTQSYTYFAWRNTKWELEQYFTELTQPGLQDFFRPNLWPNTPDILTEYVQSGGRPAFRARLALAATLGANYGIYGPAFELCENRPRSPGSEEYLNSEKYELKHWEIDRPDSLREYIARVNRIRRENPALQRDRNLVFHAVDNPQLIACSKATDDLFNIVLTVVNLDPHWTQSGWVEVNTPSLGIEDPHQPYQVHDLLDDARYLWQGRRNYVELNPDKSPAHIFRVRRHVRTEQDPDYFL